jgi:hypothetical protein
VEHLDHLAQRGVLGLQLGDTVFQLSVGGPTIAHTALFATLRANPAESQKEKRISFSVPIRGSTIWPRSGVRMAARHNQEDPMGGIGRNQPCPCGSGVKTKRCCGLRRGPSERDLAKAFLVEQRRATSPALQPAINDVDDLIELYKEVAELPGLDLSCQLRLPRLLTPELV